MLTSRGGGARACAGGARWRIFPPGGEGGARRGGRKEGGGALALGSAAASAATPGAAAARGRSSGGGSGGGGGGEVRRGEARSGQVACPVSCLWLVGDAGVRAAEREGVPRSEGPVRAWLRGSGSCGRPAPPRPGLQAAREGVGGREAAGSAGRCWRWPGRAE